jgi:hypothetical protein
MRDGDYSCAKTSQARMRDIDTIDSELRLVAALRRTARERGAAANCTKSKVGPQSSSTLMPCRKRRTLPAAI